MSAFHGEDIESETSSWKIPTTLDRFATDEALLTEKQNRYKKINKIHRNKIEAQELNPLQGNL